MINRSLIEQRISDKIKTLAFEAFINETFIKALPFNTDRLSDKSKQNLSSYTLATIESLGGYDLLTSAIESETDPHKKTLLICMDDICTESATKAAKRIVKEKKDEIDDSNSSMEEMIANSGFTKEEMDDFRKKGDSIDVDKLADIIKDKVLAVLKMEKENHERVEKINGELREVALGSTDNSDPTGEEDSETDLSDQQDDQKDMDTKYNEESDGNEESEDEELTESLVDLTDTILHGKKNEHVSFFSSIQEAACEQIIVTENSETLDPNEISLRRLKNITFENTLPVFDHKITAEDALENLVAIQSAADQENYTKHLDTVTEAAMVDSVIVYTMLESLNTLNLIHASGSDIRKAIESSRTMSQKGEINKKEFKKALESQLRSAQRLAIMGEGIAIEQSIDRFERIKSMIQDCKERVVSDEIMASLESVLSNLKGKYEKLAIANESSVESFYDRKRFEGNTAQMIRVKTLVRGTPGSKAIVFEQYPGQNSLGVCVESLCGTKSTHVTLDGYTGDVSEFRRIVSESVLMESGMPEVYLAIKDGRGTKIKIK